MKKQLKDTIESLVKGETDKRDGDMFLHTAILRGDVPETCLLLGQLVMALVNDGQDPCAGCNHDRNVCNGRPKLE